MRPIYGEDELRSERLARAGSKKPNDLTPRMTCVELQGLQCRYERDRATHVYNEWHVLGFLLREVFSLVFGLSSGLS